MKNKHFVLANLLCVQLSAAVYIQSCSETKDVCIAPTNVSLERMQCNLTRVNVAPFSYKATYK